MDRQDGTRRVGERLEEAVVRAPACTLPVPLPRRRIDERTARAIRTYPCGSPRRSEEHTSELQSLMRISYAVFSLKKNHLYSTLILYTPPTSPPLTYAEHITLNSTHTAYYLTRTNHN